MREEIRPITCLQARQYYYDYTLPKARSAIPRPILEHIGSCNACQAQIARLKRMLADQQLEGACAHDQIADVLRQHFAYAEGPVDCTVARQFLAQLADPGLSLRIPTPITLHLDQCRPCSDDLEQIRCWSLRPDQLHRLSQLLSGQTGSEVHCDRVGDYIQEACRFQLDRLDPAILAHICGCKECRDRIYLARAVLLEHIEAHVPLAAGTPDCQTISDADLFDLVMPLGLDLGRQSYARFLLPICGHIASCPECMARAQRMHRQLYGIVSRGNSEVVTYYSLGSKEDKTVHMPSSGRRLILRAAVAAAIIAGAIGLWALVPRASADPVGNLLRALGKVRRLHIEVRAGEGPSQEFWLDRDAGICLVKGPSGTTLWDARAGAKKVVAPEGGPVQVQAIGQPERAWVAAGLGSGFGLVPFTDSDSVPASARFIRAGGFEQVGLDVYELVWPGPYGNGRRRWLVTVDPASHLPRMAQYYNDSGDGQWQLDTTITVYYPTAEQFERVIGQLIPAR